MKTAVISFSSRKNGNCARIGKLIRSMTQESVLFEFSDLDIHACGQCGYECFSRPETFPHIQDAEYSLLEAVAQSEMVYFILPNYCDYPCANYFIFNERSQCFFQGNPDLLEAYLNVPKRSIVISGTNQDHFIQALAYQSAQKPEILFLSAKEYGKNSICNDLLSSEEALERVTQFVRKPL